MFSLLFLFLFYYFLVLFAFLLFRFPILLSLLLLYTLSLRLSLVLYFSSVFAPLSFLSMFLSFFVLYSAFFLTSVYFLHLYHRFFLSRCNCHLFPPPAPPQRVIKSDIPTTSTESLWCSQCFRKSKQDELKRTLPAPVICREQFLSSCALYFKPLPQWSGRGVNEIKRSVIFCATLEVPWKYRRLVRLNI